MKALRHTKIKEIVERQIVETQEEVAELLRKEGIIVTQATVSRDIKELLLIKVPTGDGRYRYAFPPEQNLMFSQSRMERIFQDAIIGMDYSQNLVILRTLPGAAQAVASTIDHVRWPEIIGTVAGDDTILIVVKPPDIAPQVMAKFQRLLS